MPRFKKLKFFWLRAFILRMVPNRQNINSLPFKSLSTIKGVNNSLGTDSLLTFWFVVLFSLTTFKACAVSAFRYNM